MENEEDIKQNPETDTENTENTSKKIEVSDFADDSNSEEKASESETDDIAADTEDFEAEGSEVEPKETDTDEIPEAEEKDQEQAEKDTELEPETEKTIGDAIDEAEEQEPEGTKSEAEIDAAVDDIVRTESDESIAEADAKLEALKEKKSKKSFKEKIAGAFAAWWNNKPARYGTFAGFGLLLVAMALLPTTRYTALNLFGVRVSSSMTVIDSQTRLPLKNINVSIQNESATTDKDGNVQFEDLKLGKSDLSITKIGYADSNREVVLGWGSNPMGEQEIQATGEQFTFVLSDWLSNQKIVNAEASAGENSAKADENGKIVLTVGQKDISAVEIYIDADNYRQEKFTTAELNKEEFEVKMVSSRKHTFVSNRSGQYDLYKIDIDKQNEEILLGSTGKEREVPVVMEHPTRNLVAYVSSRDGDENSDGYILDGLFIIDVESGETKRIARSEQLQLLGWSGDKLIFWQVVEGTSRANPERSKIISYNERTAERTDLAAANYFNDIELVNDTVYYAVASYAVPLSQAKLYSVNVDGEDTEQLTNNQVWSIYRNGYESLLFNTEDQKWFEKVGDEDLEEIGQQPAPKQVGFVDSWDGKKTAWVEIRDGRGVLLVSNTDEIKEEQIAVMPGLNNVLYWVNDTSLVFRIISNSETADYLIDITNSEPIKITDVTATQNTYF